jgi:cysteine-rich repeat protein
MKAYEWFGVVLVSLSALGCGAVCGDGELSKDEACDDGNVANADGCEANCSLPACGNGIVDPGELCLSEQRFPAPTIAGGTTFISGGDLNQDQLPDIAVALRGDNAVSVLFNQGENLFGAEQFFSLPAGDGLQDLIIADLVVNGFPDLVTANQVSTNISILQNQANQPFTQELTIELGGQSPNNLIARDLDGINGDDVVINTTNSLVVFLNDGTGAMTEAPGSPLAVPNNELVVDVMVEDIDGDGLLDVVASDTNQTIQLFLGSGGGQFDAPVQIAQRGAAQLAAGDITGDGEQDVLVFAGGVDNNFFALINQGDGTFVEQAFAISLQSDDDFFVVDLDNDGKLDVVSPRAQQGFDVCIGDGTGLLESPLNFPVTNLVNEIVISDLNEDSALDVAFTDGLTGEVVVFFSEP